MLVSFATFSPQKGQNFEEDFKPAPRLAKKTFFPSKMVNKNGGKSQSTSAVAVADPRNGPGVGSSNDGFMHYVIGNIWSCVSQILLCFWEICVVFCKY